MKRSVSTSSTIIPDENNKTTKTEGQNIKRKRPISTSSTTILDEQNNKKMKTIKGQKVKNGTNKTEETSNKTVQVDNGVQGM